MKTLLKLKDKLPYTDERGELSGQTVEPLAVLKGGFKIQVRHEGRLHWITNNDIEEKIEDLNEGDHPFDGEFAATIERLSSIENPSDDLAEAIATLQSMQKALDYVIEKGLISVRRLAKIMDCYVEDITGGL